MPYKFVVIVISMLYSFSSAAIDNFSIYLVRHAEKQQNLVDGKKNKDPLLTACGQLRAQQLARLLASANIKSIYSTSYQRTMQTASPLATKQKIAIKNYNPRHLEQLALLIKQRKQNTLVVGHSNTTPELAQLLSGKKTEVINEGDYQVLYQVQFVSGKASITRLIQPLLCSSSN